MWRVISVVVFFRVFITSIGVIVDEKGEVQTTFCPQNSDGHVHIKSLTMK